MRPMKWLCLTLAALLTAGCQDDESKSSKAGIRFQVQLDPSDSVRCAFGDSKTLGPWDELTLGGSGRIKWTHVDPITGKTHQEGFEKAAELSAEDTKKWMQDAVDLGLFDMGGGKAAGAEGPMTEIEAHIDGHDLDLKLDGPPSDALRAHLDELSARTITGR